MVLPRRALPTNKVGQQRERDYTSPRDFAKAILIDWKYFLEPVGLLRIVESRPIFGNTYSLNSVNLTS